MANATRLDRHTTEMRAGVQGLHAAARRLVDELDRIEREFEEDAEGYELADFMTDESASVLRAFEESSRRNQQRIMKAALRLMRDQT